MRQLVVALVWSGLALVGGGCVTNSTVTDGDRGVNTQTHGAAQAVQEALLAVQSLAPDSVMPQVTMALMALKDILLNSEHLEKVQGAPKEPLPYTPENAAKERARSESEHKESWVSTGALMVGGLAAGIVGTLCGMPWLASKFPALAGQVGRFATTAVSIIAAARKKGEENGGAIQITDLLGIAKEKNVTAGVQDWAVKKADQLEEKLGVNFAVSLAAQPPAAAPPLTPQPST